MDDVPALPEHTQRKLAVQWEKTRENEKLTDQDLLGYDRERQRLLAIGGIGAERSRGIGLHPSVKAAEERFNQFDVEYWRLWCTSEMQYGWYQAWLETLIRSVVDELASIWMGRSDETDQWFEHVCRPEVETALSGAAKKRVAKARIVEIDSTETRTLPYDPFRNFGFRPDDVVSVQDPGSGRYLRRSREMPESVSPGGAAKVEISEPPRRRMPPPWTLPVQKPAGDQSVQHGASSVVALTAAETQPITRQPGEVGGTVAPNPLIAPSCETVLGPAAESGAPRNNPGAMGFCPAWTGTARLQALSNDTFLTGVPPRATVKPRR